MIIYGQADCRGFISLLIIASSSEVEMGREQLVSFAQGWETVRWAWQKAKVGTVGQAVDMTEGAPEASGARRRRMVPGP